jgi:hypothetical protein
VRLNYLSRATRPGDPKSAPAGTLVNLLYLTGESSLEYFEVVDRGCFGQKVVLKRSLAGFIYNYGGFHSPGQGVNLKSRDLNQIGFAWIERGSREGFELWAYGR